jgi:hypothetical protein
VAISSGQPAQHVNILRSPTSANLPRRQSDAARVLVVHNLRGGDNPLSSLREVHTIRETIQGRLAGSWVHDPAFRPHGIGTHHFALWDQQCYHDGAHGRADLAPLDR